MNVRILPLPILLMTSLASTAAAQEEPVAADQAAAAGEAAALRVGISPFPPFVMGSPAEGYSIDLWQMVAARIDRKFEFVSCEGAADKINRLEKGELDVAIGGITTTQERESRIDFTHATYRSGLAILLPGEASKASLWSSLQSALAEMNTAILWAFFIVVFAAGHIIWFLERGSQFDKRYPQGIFDGVYWAVVTASTVGYGDKAPVGYLGRLVAMVVIIVSLPLFALFTAELASAFTVQRIEASIKGPNDLKNRTVAVVKGTSSEKYVQNRPELRIDVRPYPNAQDAIESLTKKGSDIDAVIYDEPSLIYYARNEGLGKVYLADAVFDIRDLAMAAPQGGKVRELINRALLDLEAEGKLVELRKEYFGNR